MLMRKLCDQVLIDRRDDGTTVTMRRVLSRVDPSSATDTEYS
jgi:hypothetical protein